MPFEGYRGGMESTVPTPALDQLKTIEFKVGLRGFAVAEVDDFLDQVAAEVEMIREHYREQHSQLNQQLRRAAERIKQLEGQGGTAPAVSSPAAPAPAPAPTATSSTAPTHGVDQAANLLAMTQEFIDKARATATAEASALVARAKEEARAHLEEAKSRALDEVTQLEGKKRRLTEDIATLDQFISAERDRFRTLLGEVGHWMETKFAVRQSSTPVASAPVTSAPTPASPSPTGQAPEGTPAPRPTTPPSSGDVTTIGQALNLLDDND